MNRRLYGAQLTGTFRFVYTFIYRWTVMIHIAMVEDDNKDASTIESYIKRFNQEEGQSILTTRFTNANEFFTNYKPSFDIVFLDIMLPGINGMDIAKKLREIDKRVVIMFVTTMTQYAIKGYEVNAVDYLVKPVAYQTFMFKLQKAIGVVNENKEGEILIVQPNRMIRLSTHHIQYVEVLGHTLMYHANDGVHHGRGTMANLEKEFEKYGFMRCNNCYLVNPKYIDSVDGFSVNMRNGDVLQISHPRKKKFMTDLTRWLGRGNYPL